ncbi:MAG: phosphoribosylglycinamide formyltransferase [Cytophagales bacterium]|nr:phosphoribosylglycinamide formyltransferase [Cytophagales bacterium]MDW8383723.1 phosphoribosylglycinamide formyltransferase [Flammeovirgaceae bacterium]
METPYRLALFASGTGSNVMNIVEYFKERALYKVYSNKSEAPVVQKAKSLKIDTMVFNREECYQTSLLLDDLRAFKPELIVLAGFLWLIPSKIIKEFPRQIINLHPSLLPKYGGKGMYGMKVHQAVVHNREKHTGITIHYVNENYDEGEIIFRHVILIAPEDTPEIVAQKVQKLEHQDYPAIIERILHHQRRI